jgi:predicted glycosyltransferase involved in capsule biosynthesis
MIYFIATLGHSSNIRNHAGLDDFEFLMRAKTVPIEFGTLEEARKYLTDRGYEILDRDTWMDYLEVPGVIPDEQYIGTKKHFDKWDCKPTIY